MMRFIKLQAMVPMLLPGRNRRDLRAEVTVDSDENTIEIKAIDMDATFTLMDLMKHGHIRVVIERVGEDGDGRS